MSAPLPASASLPPVLVFSEGALSRSHGTGTIFARNFSAYPAEKLENWFIGLAEDPLLPRSFNLNDFRWPRGDFSPPSTALAKLWNRFGAARFGRKWCVPVNRAAIRAAAASRGSAAEVVYAIIYSREGADALLAVLEGLGRSIPVILQIQDFFPTAHFGFRRALVRLRPHVAAVWVVAPSIARVVAPIFGLPVHVDPLFNLALPAIHKTEHHPFTADFRTVVLGNFWQPALLGDLKAAWRECQQRVPGLPAVRWHCHPAGVERVRAAGFTPEPEVTLAPFVSGDMLFSTLRDADLALIPFSRGAVPTTDYERYSMPSRITELAAAGLPIVGLTGAGTPLHEYLVGKKIGECAPASDASALAGVIAPLVLDAGKRAALGRTARALAEKEFPLAQQQAWIYGEFARYATGSRAPAHG